MSSSSDVSSTTSLVTTTTRTYISGNSGFDTSSLIEAAVEAELIPAYTLETKVENNELRMAAYEELNGLLDDINNVLDLLRNEPGSTGTTSVFEEREAYLTASDGSTASNTLTVTADANAAIGSYEIEVLQIATAQKVGTNTVSDPSAALGLDGSFTIAASDGTAQTIAVDSKMSLEDICDTINASSNDSGVRATLLNVSDSESILVLSSVETGQTLSYTSESGDDIGVALGLVDETSGDFANSLQDAQNAIIEIDGVRIERSSNTLDDVIDGLTIDLYAANAGKTVTVEIDYNYADAKAAVVALVDAVNAFLEFYAAQSELGENGLPAQDAVLFGDSLLRGTQSAIFSDLLESLTTDDGAFSLPGLGITLTKEGSFVVEEDTLDNALLENFKAIATLFEFQFSADSDDLAILSHDNVLASGTYSIDITVDSDGNLESASIDGDSSLFTISGTRIIGAEGSKFEGLTLVYLGKTDQTIEFTLHQGIADSLYDRLETYCNETDSLLVDAVKGLEDSNKDMAKEIAEIQGDAQTLEARLIDYYAELEARISQANTTLDLLKALNSSDD